MNFRRRSKTESFVTLAKCRPDGFSQHLYERSWFAVTETCLAMTIFRDEFDTRFVAIFTLLLFLKIFHWLAQDRVDYVCRRLSLLMSLRFAEVVWIFRRPLSCCRT